MGLVKMHGYIRMFLSGSLWFHFERHSTRFSLRHSLTDDHENEGPEEHEGGDIKHAQGIVVIDEA